MKTFFVNDANCKTLFESCNFLYEPKSNGVAIEVNQFRKVKPEDETHKPVPVVVKDPKSKLVGKTGKKPVVVNKKVPFFELGCIKFNPKKKVEFEDSVGIKYQFDEKSYETLLVEVRAASDENYTISRVRIKMGEEFRSFRLNELDTLDIESLTMKSFSIHINLMKATGTVKNFFTGISASAKNYLEDMKTSGRIKKDISSIVYENEHCFLINAYLDFSDWSEKFKTFTGRKTKIYEYNPITNKPKVFPKDIILDHTWFLKNAQKYVIKQFTLFNYNYTEYPSSNVGEWKPIVTRLVLQERQFFGRREDDDVEKDDETTPIINTQLSGEIINKFKNLGKDKEKVILDDLMPGDIEDDIEQ